MNRGSDERMRILPPAIRAVTAVAAPLAKSAVPTKSMSKLSGVLRLVPLHPAHSRAPFYKRVNVGVIQTFDIFRRNDMKDSANPLEGFTQELSCSARYNDL